MTDNTSSHDLFRPKGTRSETKAESTNRLARAIIQTENKRRESKTEKLRQARLENGALEIATSVPAPKQRAAEPKRTGSPSTKCRSGDKVIT